MPSNVQTVAIQNLAKEWEMLCLTRKSRIDRNLDVSDGSLFKSLNGSSKDSFVITIWRRAQLVFAFGPIGVIEGFQLVLRHCCFVGLEYGTEQLCTCVKRYGQGANAFE